MRNINRRVFVLVLFISIIFINGCTSNDKRVLELVVDRGEFTKSKYTPNNGVTIDKAKIIISDYLEKEAGVKGNFTSEIEVKEITNLAIWESNNHQVYRVTIDYAWLDGIIVLKNGVVEKFLWGQDIIDVIAADLDKDGDYEICMSSNFGSGFVRSLLLVYDSTSNQEYKLENNVENWDISIASNEAGTEVLVYGNEMNGREESKRVLGKLRIENEKLIVVD